MSENNLISCQVEKSFLGLFTHDIIDEKIGNGNPSNINLFTLKIQNNNFIYDRLVEDLDERIITFCTPRKTYNKAVKEKKFGKLSKEARRKLRKHTANEGEAGELLLYCLLESYLNAPKLLSKFDIKTSSNDYVKGADGVHLLEIEKNKYQLIFGEAKLEKELTSSLYSAFKSINTFVTRKHNNSFHETHLIIGELDKECESDGQYNFIKSILIPSEHHTTTTDNAFGIFAGFNIEISEEEKKLSNDNFRKMITKKVSASYKGKIKYIENKIEEYGLWGYTFYIYVVPFINMDFHRKDIIAQLKDYYVE